ncbi:hypothetical protein CGLO_08504 [Colletotrichum gloeosporioides Cg-14]|uniref:Uncharacterized protein n=1 Tax=Colletotrichum gloeosporioides (strain Cg-14) TaxID=1237896 RepID=T0LJS1_COLGC|nr:hypothetical protein CGLO_08504 [Colletotrichum gloeosporioides Cg-14]
MTITPITNPITAVNIGEDNPYDFRNPTYFNFRECNGAA